MNYELSLPAPVTVLLRRLNESGFSAYVVGGCVRDSMLGLEPHDWDICTSALPEQMQEVFHDLHTVETGLKHGTLTVVVDHVPYEVTTYRIDGDYTDHRHPDSVHFVDNLTEDLARRDFTVNAMAWNPETGLADPFDGQADLAAGLIRCVGEAEKRFDEDALRILRALPLSLPPPPPCGRWLRTFPGSPGNGSGRNCSSSCAAKPPGVSSGSIRKCWRRSSRRSGP